jgi:adenylosuccinate synthase
MPVVALIGAQWGDEGKGHLVDLLAARARLVIRYGGGNNAGHTVVNHLGTFKLHLVPSGIFDPGIVNVIGPGVVINPEVLIKEIDDLEARGVSTAKLFVSDRAHVIMPYHIQLDQLQEEARGEGKIGTTGRGIGPAFRRQDEPFRDTDGRSTARRDSAQPLTPGTGREESSVDPLVQCAPTFVARYVSDLLRVWTTTSESYY